MFQMAENKIPVFVGSERGEEVGLLFPANQEPPIAELPSTANSNSNLPSASTTPVNCVA